MGCHTWFLRPITNQEIESAKAFAELDVKEFFKADYLSYQQAKELLLSIKHNSTCPSFNNETWYSLGYGIDSIQCVHKDNSGIFYDKNKPIYIDCSCDSACECVASPNNESMPCSNCNEFSTHFHDVFRVNNYPKWTIHNKKELRRHLKKNYFNLTVEQHERLSSFWKLYPHGIIKFG